MQVMLKDRYRALFGACQNGFVRERLHLLDEDMKERVRKITRRLDVSHPRLPVGKRAREPGAEEEIHDVEAGPEAGAEVDEPPGAEAQVA